MSSKNDRRISTSVTFRLTVWYFVLLAALLAVVFAVVHWRLTAALEQRVDNKIIVKMGQSPLLDDAFFMRPLTTLESARDFFYWDSVVEGTETVFWALLSYDMRILASSDLTQWQISFGGNSFDLPDPRHYLKRKSSLKLYSHGTRGSTPSLVSFCGRFS